MFSLGGKEWVFRVSIRGFLLGRKSVLSHEGGGFSLFRKKKFIWDKYEKFFFGWKQLF